MVLVENEKRYHGNTRGEEMVYYVVAWIQPLPTCTTRIASLSLRGQHAARGSVSNYRPATHEKPSE